MAVIYNTIDVEFPKEIKRREISMWIKEVVAQYQRREGDIAYVFCSDEEILRMNKQYLNHHFYTDIITFDYSEKNRISGDLFISLDSVKSNAEKFGTEYSEELYRVMIHGVLHLCGLKDKLPKDKKMMRQGEEEALAVLAISQGLKK